MKELKLIRGNEAISEAAMRLGVDAYFGYPITPQSEIMEYLMAERAYETMGMFVLQAESEIGAINMIYGAACCGKKVFTSSSSPGTSLFMEGISYLAGAELPCLIVNVVRGSPGLGNIQPAQCDYFQAVKGGGHGDYRLIVLAPWSVQEMADFVKLGFDLAFKYRNPAIILTDGLIGQMMEKVEFDEPIPRLTDDEIKKLYPWATTGKTTEREPNIISSFNLDPHQQEQFVLKLIAKYEKMEEEEVRFEKIKCDDAEYLLVAYGSSARICRKAVELARAKNIKVGLLRPITLYPFPKKEIFNLSKNLKGILVVEMSTGQMVEDVLLATRENRTKVEHFGRVGGVVHTPEEVLKALEIQLLGGPNYGKKCS